MAGRSILSVATDAAIASNKGVLTSTSSNGEAAIVGEVERLTTPTHEQSSDFDTWSSSLRGFFLVEGDGDI